MKEREVKYLKNIYRIVSAYYDRKIRAYMRNNERYIINI